MLLLIKVMKNQRKLKQVVFKTPDNINKSDNINKIIYIIGLIIIVIVWIFLWVFFGLFKFDKYSFIFFFGYIFVLMIDIFNEYKKIRDDGESVYFATFEYDQNLSKIMGVFGIIILVYILLGNMKLKNSEDIKKLLIISIIIISIPILVINLKNQSINLNDIEFTLNKIYNQSLFLFLFALYLIFVRIQK